MTPSSLAFTIIRCVAVCLVFVGVGALLAFGTERISLGADSASSLYLAPGSLFAVLCGLLLYALADRLAKAAVGQPGAPSDQPLPSSQSSNPYNCSFCGKSHADVRKLIAGPGVNICDKCVIICKDLLDKEPNKESQS